MRPCRHEPPDASCAVCWHYLNVPAYRALYDGMAEPAAAARPATPPGLARQAVNFAVEMAEWLAAGMPRTPDDELAKRKSTCIGDGGDVPACVHLEDGRCRKCGCPLESRPLLLGLADRPGKLEMATTRCPEDRWGPARDDADETNRA